MLRLKTLKIKNVNLDSSILIDEIKVSYETFGQEISKKPIVLIIHPLTGNSSVCGKNGWWKQIVKNNGSIDTKKYSILAFNIPGNGYDGILYDNYSIFNTGDIAKIFFKALEKLGIKNLHAAIGGSIGAAICWELAALYPNLIKHLISVAGDWKATDWMIANSSLQSRILNNSSNPIQDARMHAMLCYRTPKSFRIRFNRSFNKEKNIFNVESWLFHHGQKLEDRFELKAYKMMNHLLGSINIERYGEKIESIILKIKSEIHIISIDSDLFFPLDEDKNTVKIAESVGVKINHKLIKSEFGHDAFLMEFDQMKLILKEIF